MIGTAMRHSCHTKTMETQCKNCQSLKRELEELREEMHALQLDQYWKFNNISYLQIEMHAANDILPELRCKCAACVPVRSCSKHRHQAPASDFKPASGDSEIMICKFRPWFLKLLEEVGLTFQVCEHDGARLTEAEESEVHIVVPSAEDANMMKMIRYGGWLKNARYQSADLKLLDRLFEVLAQKQDACVL